MKKTLIIIAIVIAAMIVLYFGARVLPEKWMLPFFIGAGAGAAATVIGQQLWDMIRPAKKE